MMEKLKQMVQHKEEGQSLIIVGALLVVLVALIGLVVDAGNAYAQRRIVQNAADAAALAGSQMLVHQEDYLTGGNFLRNWQVIQAVEDYAERNGVDPDNLSIYYTDIDGNILADARFDLGRQDIIKEDTFGGTRAEGVRVEADLPFPTYLVRVIGRDEMTASGSANGILACGACTTRDIFPMAIHAGTFSDGYPVVGQTYRVIGNGWKWRTSHNRSGPGPGNFGFISWDENRQGNAELARNMEDTERSGQWSVGDSVATGPGPGTDDGSVRDQLRARIDNNDPDRPAEVTVPIFDYTCYDLPSSDPEACPNGGSDLKFHIVGFARFQIQCFYFYKAHREGYSDYYYGDCDFDENDHSNWISGTFVQWVDPTGEAGCTNFGICSAELRPPLEVKRTLVGNVIPWQVRPAEDQICEGGDRPVDLVHIIDISGSMCYEWDGTYDQNPPCTGRADYGSPNRIYAAKQIITDFNEGMDWHPDNQIGLTTYPRLQHVATYQTGCYEAMASDGDPDTVCSYDDPDSDCYRWGEYLGTATKDVPLTGVDNVAYVNNVIDSLTAEGGTSLPAGLQYGREMVSDPDTHNPDNTKVIILTTDGMPNIASDGVWTGYVGRYTRPWMIEATGCNDMVYQQAIEQANLAKQEGDIIFTIGIHTSIDEDLMRAIASPDTDPSQPHFFLAESDMDFGQIYDQIMERLPTICSEECIANENATVGTGAIVRLYDDNGNLVATTTADASGGFTFTDLEPGTYELRASWTDPHYGLLYDVLTWVLGGPPLEEGERITVEIPLGTGSTHKDVYLRTSEQIDCND